MLGYGYIMSEVLSRFWCMMFSFALTLSWEMRLEIRAFFRFFKGEVLWEFTEWFEVIVRFMSIYI